MRLTALLVAFIFITLSAAPARAAGTLQIHDSSGSFNTYTGVTVNVFSGSLFITSADGKGTLVVNRSACSYQSKIIVCLPTSVILVQKRKEQRAFAHHWHALSQLYGEAQPLRLSSAKVPAHAVILSFTTANGTYVTLHGTLDQVIKQ